MKKSIKKKLIDWGGVSDRITIGKVYQLEGDIFKDNGGFMRGALCGLWEDIEDTSVEHTSGDSCDYYKAQVDNPISIDEPYIAECYDLIKALNLTWEEANIFKEIWRTGNARNGNGKKGNTDLRAAQKIKFFAKQNLKFIELGK